jgi:hypothetical protein
MTNQLSGRPVDVDPFEVIQLRTITVENFSTHYNADVNTLAVEYIAFTRASLLQVEPCESLRSFAVVSEPTLWGGFGHRRAASAEHKAGQWLIELASLSPRRDQQSSPSCCRKRNIAIR